MNPSRISVRVGSVIIVGSMVAAGCNVDGRWTQYRSPLGSEAARVHEQSAHGAAGAPELHPQEVDLVEALLRHRSEYHNSLDRLCDYYRRSGNTTKAGWAGFERKGLRSVKQFRYFLDAEIPSGEHKATEQDPEADALFQRGLELMRRGGRGVPGFYREDRMVEAAGVFRKLIDDHPNSDKIDDGAFYLGEIHEEYLPEQEVLAAGWYERAWTWNPVTPHPARYRAAVIYDNFLHDRDRALELYHGVVKQGGESAHVHHAIQRIEELSGAEFVPSRRAAPPHED